ncbi:MAG: PTS fructose transporter subunit IID, partial [Lactobacillus crispatus]|nr:PTS fructose transporter subunit IID [Lactobacillus crispatus]
WTPTKIILLILVFCLVGSAAGFLGVAK